MCTTGSSGANLPDKGPNKGRPGHTAPPGDGCTQDHGRSRGRGAEGAPDGQAWVGRGVGALLSQDSPSGLLRDDPSANKTFLKSLVQKSNIYLAGTVSLYKVSPS